MKNASSLFLNQQPWDEEFIFTDGDLFFTDVLQSIQNAKRSIDVETYIFNRDQIGKDVLDALVQATSKGVQVRLLIDGIGCYDWTARDVQDLKEKGLSIRVFHPLPWHQSTSLSLQKFVKNFSKLKRRNHRKCIIIDNQLAYCGSINITGNHCRSVMKEQAWRDTAVRLKGYGLVDLQSEFDWIWNISEPNLVSETPNEKINTSIVRANSSYQRRHWLFKDLFQRIIHAKKRVWIMTPYFVPRISFIYALRMATLHNVDVRILLPNKSDIGPLRRLAHTFYSKLLKHKIRIFEYQPSTLHGKVYLIDDWVTVGSTNLNYRSMVYDYELDVVLSKPDSLATIQQQFEQDFQKSEEIKAIKWRNRSLWERLLETLVLPFKNWS